MKISLGYPSLDDPRGFHQTGQNRQAQVFTAPAFIYPVIPAFAATMLKNAGHEILWLDGPAEGIFWEEQLRRIKEFHPDLLAWEVKTPSVKLTWSKVDDVKREVPSCRVVLMGDHITALPQESLDRCRADVCMTGGDYDFGLMHLVQNPSIRGIYQHPTTSDLKALPVIDRRLTRWELYGYEKGSGNYKYLPGTHYMAGRDCFVAGTLIETNEGHIPVEHIEVDHSVKTHTGRYRRVFEKRSREVPQTLLIKTYCNWPVQCSPEHPFWTNRGWVEAKDLRENQDYIGYPIAPDSVDAESLYGIPTDAESMWIYGLYLAEGYLGPKRHGIHFCLGPNEDDLRRRLMDICLKKGYDVSLKVTKTAQQVIVNGGNVLSYGIVKLFGTHASKKFIHPFVLRLPIDKIRSLTDGYFLGDGFVESSASKRFGSVTVSKRLAIDLRNMLLRVGVIASTYTANPYWSEYEGRQIRGQHSPYHLSITRQFANAWGWIAPSLLPNAQAEPENIPSSLYYSNAGGHSAYLEGGYAWYRVRSLKEAGPAVVYNFSVEGDQSYIADGLAVHNCWWRHDGGCTFCSWTNTFKNWRVGSVDQFMAEVENCASVGIRELFDDTGTFPIGKWLQECCQQLIKFNKGKRHGRARVTIGCNMRPGALNQEEYDLMGAAGFRFILYGLESANYETLVKINKGQKENAMFETARMAKRAGLEPHVTCMVGYPWESKEDALRTIHFTQDLFARGWIDTLQATICIPYPGTALFRQCQQNGWLKTDDWNDYSMDKPVMKCPMTDEEVLGMTRGIYKSFMTPRYVFRKLVNVRTKDDVKFLWRGLRLLGGHLTDFSGKRPHLATH